ncbi:hypothetical protein [Planococcus lenghuensis]|uniref:hypothetical protein n=1 Tax=Planococcus lenghuensis TaxID=2213202 RepID=UPI0018DDE439|nr:hypothetical protein [Planococcus lenghuensis]
MRKAIFYLIPVICIILVVLLYNEQFGAIPFLLLSIYLFYAGWKLLNRAKKKSR